MEEPQETLDTTDEAGREAEEQRTADEILSMIERVDERLCAAAVKINAANDEYEAARAILAAILRWG